MREHPIDTRILVFDLFGTLVDQDRGLAAALAREAGIDGLPALALLAARVEREQELVEELEEFRPWGEILAESLVRAAADTGLALPPGTAARVAATVDDWPLFPDVPAALPRLARRYRLAAIAGAEEPVLERLLARLPVPFAHSVPAERVGCYLPEPDLLLALMHEMVADEHELALVSAWPDRDLAVATDLGIPAIYVDRRGLPLPAEIEVPHRVRDLGELAERLAGRRARRRVAPRRRRR